MEPAKFTAAELGRFDRSSRFVDRGAAGEISTIQPPLIAEQKAHLQPFFSAKTLDRLRIVEASKMGEKTPYPPFYEKVRAGARAWCPMPCT